MKNLNLIIAVFLGLLTLSCSSDEGGIKGDPIFSAEYIPLKDLSDLGKGTYFYAGFKAEGRKVSLLAENTDSCQKDDIFAPVFNANGDLIFFQFHRSNSGCIGGYTVILLTNNQLLDTGIMETSLYSGGSYSGEEEKPGLEEEEKPSFERIVKSTLDVVKSRERYDGPLEIGFQGGYLRIEDRMSHYSRPKQTDKVYLYFKSKEK
ncbi:hypothetical protein [Myroides odoratus]|uniref:hypothetical protein n=1 Tax=Myroides odoratus TaxID=256 RepID=UPI0039B096CF